MPEGLGGPGGQEGNEIENVHLLQVPRELTNGKMVIIEKMRDGEPTGEALGGALRGGIIQVGESMDTPTGHSTEVVAIHECADGAYAIRTKSGSEYRFNPSKARQAETYNIDNETGRGVEVNSIPGDQTEGVLILTKYEGGEKTSFSIFGALSNGPIEVGKSVKLAVGNTSQVERILCQNGEYIIFTNSGSEYHLESINSTDQ